MPRYLKERLRAALRQPILAPVYGWLLARSLRELQKASRPDAIAALVFSEFRWRQDLEALASTGELQLYAADSRLIDWINSLFQVFRREPNPEYFMESDPEILRLRKQQIAFVTRIVRSLLKHRRLDCALTPAIHYRKEHAWAYGCDAACLPFIALHKELSVIDWRQLPERVARFKARRQTFLGSHVCVTNQTAKRLLAEAEVFPPERISVTGLLRTDNLLRSRQPQSSGRVERRPAITLFSFGHFSGGLGIPQRRSHYFSLNDDYGFVELFHDVHAAVAEAALVHPEGQFHIKPKNVEPWWTTEIEKVVAEATGQPLSKIANCGIVDRPAPELIVESRAVIGFNSTVLLEAQLLGCQSIIPLFHEAAERHSEHVFFKDFLDLFAVARSKDELSELLERAIKGERLVEVTQRRLSELCCAYFGYDDGRTAERAVAVLRSVIAGTPSHGMADEKQVA